MTDSSIDRFPTLPHGKPILCLDFDGCIHSYKSGWKGEDVIPDPPVPGIYEWMEKALKVFEIHVYSSRSLTFAGRAAMAKYIASNGGAHLVGGLIFSAEKPRAFLMIDDRCVRFDGDWSDPTFDPETLAKFIPWYKS